MLKIIIADDERSIRETISQLIDWNSLDLELVAQCQLRIVEPQRKEPEP